MEIKIKPRTRKERPSYEELNSMFLERGYNLLTKHDGEYKLSDKVDYTCNKHLDKGIMKITPSHFLNGRGCYYCGRERTENAKRGKFSKETDINICNLKDLKYIKTSKKNGKPTVIFICNKHSFLGEQEVLRSNLYRESSKGCSYCSGKNLPSWYMIKEIESKHPNIKVESEYIGMNKKLKCYCKKHNYHFEKDAKYILNQDNSCKYCFKEHSNDWCRLSEFEVTNIIYNSNPHIELVDYSYYHNYDSKIPIRCKKCGYEWNTSTLHSIKANNVTCPSCSKRFSKGEEKIIDYLKKNNIDFIPQKTFEDCVGDKKSLPFDVCINKDNDIYLVEYQGEQHYEPIEFFGGEYKYEIRLRYDAIKKKYCENNNIPLLIIPYTEYENIDNLLTDFLNNKQLLTREAS